ncbi:glutathione peroxidase [Salipiger abyssi]|uniref:glutathione peroxidase n=1 Tax=Salipiger abyssi TaxID=1250539 RepID=UPI001A8E1095|nr:glutathione peroxidase [Salipiger abyssi]MBN9887350.1 glutathione peroxidase [Salipiger abyssi]
MIRILATLAALTLALPALAAQSFTFDSIDGGTLSLDRWKGRPVLVVNTASRCGFTPQYDGLQALYDRYRDRGLVVLAVPSDDFRQELGSEEEVKAFCELNFALDLPMTTITRVTGEAAHPLYRWLAAQGFEPGWNFNKALIGPDGGFVEGWGATTRPLSEPIVTRIEALLE